MEIIFYLGFLVLFLIFAHSVFSFMNEIRVRQKEQNNYIAEFAKSLNKDAPSAEQIELKVQKETAPKKIKKGWVYNPSRDIDIDLKGERVDLFD